jgi:succinate dehydrogenase flavin-adding protein (antitoxin of CptAB toxin-antitoxin module)
VVILGENSEISIEQQKLIDLFEAMNGYPSPFTKERIRITLIDSFPENGVGFSQFNEYQLALGYNIVNRTFFQYLLDNTVEIKSNMSFQGIQELETAINRFIALALIFFGNVKHAFDRLSTDADDLLTWIVALEPIDEQNYKSRHEPLQEIKPISGKETYYLGHLIQKKIKEFYDNNPDNDLAHSEYEKSQEIVQVGKQNYLSYLESDHLDVYIATSMRQREEYYFVNRWVGEIFNSVHLNELKLRWFDPTQAYCDNRIDKGLFEGLMLKRAKCTIYFVQESDTFGKASELASTLAQGKPVIAFVPKCNEEYIDELIKCLQEIYPEKKLENILFDKLKEYNSRLAWEDEEVISWIADPDIISVERAKIKLCETITNMYDSRAALLSDYHPLGIQVDIERGVANGVLVVRDIEDCARIVKRIVTKTLSFKIDKNTDTIGQRYIYLREGISNCIYRLATGDPLLTNTFWNYYNAPSE